MPFVMMCGLPSSGKSHYTSMIKKYLEDAMHKKVVVISDTMFCKDKNSVFMSNADSCL
jgi:tRNA uridine 5-carbamoylmethylation protein Kti12